MAFSWGYQDHNGSPSEWHKEFPIAKEGKRQSPIDILTENVVEAHFDIFENPLQWQYTAKHFLNVENLGTSWQANLDGTGSTLTGGPFTDEYELWQIHAHWGKNITEGSEHTVDGKSYAGEIHLIHWNRTKYPTPNVAAGHGDGLAILGIFLDASEDSGEAHQELAKLLPFLGNIPYKGDKTLVTEAIDPGAFLPHKGQSRKIWTYEGSLTIPPLLECVLWILFQEPIKVGPNQVDAMRHLRSNDRESNDETFILSNFRPTVPIGGRIVKEA